MKAYFDSLLLRSNRFINTLAEIMPTSLKIISVLPLALLLLAGLNSPLRAAPEVGRQPGSGAPAATTLTANWSKAYFRGTPNNWGTTEMVLAGNNVWETTQDFTGQTDPRFKIDRKGDWLEAYPSQDYKVTPGIYRIQFNDQSKQITLIPVGTGWQNAYFRGTPNNWGSTAMNKAGDLWEITQDFTGQRNPRFKIDHRGDWSESYPPQDFAVPAKKYKIQFNDQTKGIIVTEILPTIVATPIISPNGGTLFTSQSVSLGTTTPNATLYYTTDGSTPTTESAVYSTSFSLPAGRITVKAIATKSGLQDSAEANAAFTVSDGPKDKIRVYVKDYSRIYYWNVQPAVLPKLDWPGKDLQTHPSGWRYYEFPGVNSVNLIFNNPAQTPDLSRTTGTWWYKNGVWFDHDPDGPVIPVITAIPAPDRFTDSQQVALQGSNPDDRIYYTTDGSTPTTASIEYKGPISVPAGAVTPLKAIAINRDQVIGQEYSFFYDINPDYDVLPPEIQPSKPTGTYAEPLSVAFTITDNKEGVKAYYTTDNRQATPADPPYLSGTPISVAKTTRFNILAVDTSGKETNKEFFYAIGPRADFRGETIYFVITSRFYDGDAGNNTYCWDDQAAGNRKNNDPCWRGDFKGLIQKLDYIKALGFSAIWITPVVKNMSGYDYHGYHAVNHKEIDPRNLSADTSYQDLIDAAHAKGIKVIQDIVLNHTSNFGEENLYPLFKKDPAQPDIPANLINIAPPGKLPANYDSLNPGQQYQARIAAMKEDTTDTQHIYHHEKSLQWESYLVQTGQIAGDCVDLNTENPLTYQYLIDAYNQYIDMGVDAFRVDTIKHISRLTFNKAFLPAFGQRGGEDFYIFGELASRFRQVWNHDIPAISTPFYTWKESKDYPWSATDRLVNEKSTLQNYNDNSTVTNQPASDNHLLRNNAYRKPDWSRRSHLDVIDFPMHWNFNNAHDAFRVAVDNDQDYNDATWNVTYVDSHDYAPDGAPEDKRFSGSQATWAENLSLIFTFRGIPTLYYGSEIEFKKGSPIDKGPTVPLEGTGRAYFGDNITGSVAVSDFGVYSNSTGNLATTLNHPLAQHIRRLNLIRRAVPALQRGQYSTENSSGADLAFKRRYTDATTDSMALVTISGDATFNGIPNGTYKDAITGDVKVVNNGSLSTSGCNGQGNMRVYVLDTARTPAPGKVGEAGTYLK